MGRRAALRDAIVSVLRDNVPAVSGRVYTRAVDAIPRSKLPAIVVSLGTSPVSYVSGGQQPDRLQERRQQVSVTVVSDAAVDDYFDEVETIADAAQAVLASRDALITAGAPAFISLDLTQEDNPGEFKTESGVQGGLVLTYEATILTTENEPSVAIGNT